MSPIPQCFASENRTKQIGFGVSHFFTGAKFLAGKLCTIVIFDLFLYITMFCIHL